ncbi:Ser/Thr protein kinase RdoA involved in Cpx stress response, MazF antagonist [Pseudomonas sp. 43mfcvi1.1]|uniref:phosphotransferase enzyme family protein n=1 Tax=Pseudomonas sp. 43mfcvi1.1 TaxID=1761894 RepID=UPI000D7A1BF2|nr:phosphotransferase [Pseudomonas sp. 43mfcvi1.1]PWJ32851.1 Ser/Thr protein kinase RdoA (MazF antagonist) [Pseudomonas sp. 43mfcvi1.1]SSB98509.1 Ser/Thr protein kinase RdoA involved in Cpx stress response, MazF antagonist [Pseudomonas sp. 43mfcvi1.1]
MATVEALMVHGLSHEPVAADWPPLDTRDVEQLLLGYPQLGPLLSLNWHSPRPFSAASLVQTRAATVFIKRHHQRIRTPAWLSEEHRFMAHLRQRGVPVSQVLADRNGETAVAQGEWTYEVHGLAEGQDLYRESLSWTPFFSQQHAWSAGASLARLHLAAKDYQAAPRQTPVLLANFKLCTCQDLRASLQKAIHLDPVLTDYMSQHDWRGELLPLLLPWHRQLQPLLGQQPGLWTHNDWHGSNLLWSSSAVDAAVSCVLDFGLSDRTFALFDLATAIERNGIPWLELDDGGSAQAALDDIDALLDGYASEKPLSSADLLTLAALLPLVHVDFALSEIAYFQGVVGSTASADVAYHAYLLGHTRWFSTEPGQSLLDHLRRLALTRSSGS